jgi:hypothetical protein
MRTRETRKCDLQLELLEERFALSGGVVLPSSAMPHGYSLTAMSKYRSRQIGIGNPMRLQPKAWSLRFGTSP